MKFKSCIVTSLLLSFLISACDGGDQQKTANSQKGLDDSRSQEELSVSEVNERLLQGIWRVRSQPSRALPFINHYFSFDGNQQGSMSFDDSHTLDCLKIISFTYSVTDHQNIVIEMGSHISSFPEGCATGGFSGVARNYTYELSGDQLSLERLTLQKVDRILSPQERLDEATGTPVRVTAEEEATD